MPLAVGGFVPFSTVDWPGHLTAVVFCQGCPWQCRYCHNTHLQLFHLPSPPNSTWPDLLEIFARRRGLLDGVVFSGGEATAQPGLLRALHEVQAMGFRTGLHTAGMFPLRFARHLPHLDWVGLDIKAPFDHRYDAVTGRPDSASTVSQSLRLLLESGVDYELRTTMHPQLLDESAREAIRRQLADFGAKPTRWQDFRPEGCFDDDLLATT